MALLQRFLLRSFPLGVGIAGLVCGLALGLTVAVASAATTFEFTGSVQTFVVPTGVTILNVDTRGAQGGAGPELGGVGGRVQTVIAVTPGETLHILVGGVGGSNVVDPRQDREVSMAAVPAGQGAALGDARGEVVEEVGPQTSARVGQPWNVARLWQEGEVAAPASLGATVVA